MVLHNMGAFREGEETARIAMHEMQKELGGWEHA